MSSGRRTRMHPAIGLGIGGARALTGLLFLVAPARPTANWVGDQSTPARYLARAVGGRDLAIGLGTMAATLRDEPVWPWLAASVAGDVTDAATSIVMLNGSQRRTALAYAGGFAAVTGLAIALGAARARSA